ncbi:MAG: hypothetical protein KBT01_04075 [Clostridiales bacterium]|nr:hypothetical protein [Candidatus Blautia equi]
MWKKVVTGGLAVSMIFTQPTLVNAEAFVEETEVVTEAEATEETDSAEPVEIAVDAETETTEIPVEEEPEAEAAESADESEEPEIEAVEEQAEEDEVEDEEVETENEDSTEEAEAEDEDVYPEEDTTTEESEEEIPELLLAAEEPAETGSLTLSLRLLLDDQLWGISEECIYSDYYFGLFSDAEGAEQVGDMIALNYESSSYEYETVEDIPYGTYYVLPMKWDGEVLPYNETIVRGWYDDNTIEEIFYAADGETNVITISDDQPAAELNMIRKSKEVRANTAYDGNVTLHVSYWDSNHEYELEEADPYVECYIGFWEPDAEDPYNCWVNACGCSELDVNLMLHEEGLTYYDIYLVDVSGQRVDTEDDDFPYILTGEGTFEFDHESGDVHRDVYLDFQRKDVFGSVEVSVEQMTWDWYTEGYLGLISDDELYAGLFLDDEGTELYGTPQRLYFRGDSLQKVTFENVEYGHYYVFLMDNDGIVHKESEPWYFHADGDDEYEPFYYTFLYESLEDSDPFITVDAFNKAPKVSFVYKNDMKPTGYSYAGRYNLTLTCWDEDHKNMIEPDEPFHIALYREGLKDYDEILMLRAGETVSYPVLIKDTGSTYYDVCFVSIDSSDDGVNVYKLEDMDYTVTGDQHVVFNPDEGIYEIDIKLELQKKKAPAAAPAKPSSPSKPAKPAKPSKPAKAPAAGTTHGANVKPVKTGDESTPMLYLMLMLVSLTGIAVVLSKKKHA